MTAALLYMLTCAIIIGFLVYAFLGRERETRLIHECSDAIAEVIGTRLVMHPLAEWGGSRHPWGNDHSVRTYHAIGYFRERKVQVEVWVPWNSSQLNMLIEIELRHFEQVWSWRDVLSLGVVKCNGHTYRIRGSKLGDVLEFANIQDGKISVALRGGIERLCKAAEHIDAGGVTFPGLAPIA